MKIIHTIKDITDGNKSVTLADLVKIADKKGIPLNEVFVSVSQNRWSTYRDLKLTVATKPKPPQKFREVTLREVTLSPKQIKIMYGDMLKSDAIIVIN